MAERVLFEVCYRRGLATTNRKQITRHTNQGEGIKNSGIGANKVSLNHDDLIKFSYKYADLSHDISHLNDRDTNYFMALIHRLHDLCNSTVSELKASRNRTLRFHSIDWDDTTQNLFGLPNEDDLVDQSFQFSLSGNEHGRIHGFFIDNVFYIVWFDPNHQLYP